MHILVVEDDKNSADILYKVLREEKYKVTVARSYNEAKQQLDENIFSLILLDWHLGDGSGYELLKELRDDGYDTPVIMITSQSDLHSKVDSLDVGADDYITKPYSTMELLARIRAISRRESTKKTSFIEVGDIKLDLASHKVFVKEKETELTTTEFNVLKLLMQNLNVVLSRFQINEHITKDFANLGNSNIVDVHIKNIRKKLGDSNIIKTVRGIGYTIDTTKV